MRKNNQKHHSKNGIKILRFPNKVRITFRKDNLSLRNFEWTEERYLRYEEKGYLKNLTIIIKSTDYKKIFAGSREMFSLKGWQDSFSFQFTKDLYGDWWGELRPKMIEITEEVDSPDIYCKIGLRILAERISKSRWYSPKNKANIHKKKGEPTVYSRSSYYAAHPFQGGRVSPK